MQYLFGSESEDFPLRFRDYIRSRLGVELILKSFQDERGIPLFGVFIEENSPQLAEITKEKAQFLRNPFDPRYGNAGWQVGRVVVHPAKSVNSFSLLQAPKFTLFLTALCLVIYTLQNLGMNEMIMEMFHYPVFYDQDLELWRYITHTLIHLSLLHLVFNLSWWWIFGSMIERHYGAFRLLILYLISAISSGTAQYYAIDSAAFFGLSGVVYAVLGYVFIIDRYSCRFHLPAGFLQMLLIGLALGFIMPLVDIQIGNAAHIGGLLTGIIMGWLQCKIDCNINELKD